MTDNLSGLDATIESKFEQITIQKCVLHLKRQVLIRTKKSHKQAISEELKTIFAVEDKNDTLEKAQKRANKFYDKWSKTYSHLKIFNQPDQLAYYFSYLNYHSEI